MNKVKKLADLKRIIKRLKKEGRKIVFTNGCFDILHYGHIKYLEKCKCLGDVLIVGLNSDLSVRKIKGSKRPIIGQRERATVLSALECVDYVVLFSDRTPVNLIKSITPNMLAKGGDWKKKEIVGARHVRRHGGTVVTIPFIKGYSTTRILRLIKNA